MSVNREPYGLNVEDACQRYSLIYTGAIADVLDEMGYRNQCLHSPIQGLTMDSKVAGVAMTVEGQATSSVDPEEIYIPVLKMVGRVMLLCRNRVTASPRILANYRARRPNFAARGAQ